MYKGPKIEQQSINESSFDQHLWLAVVSRTAKAYWFCVLVCVLGPYGMSRKVQNHGPVHILSCHIVGAFPAVNYVRVVIPRALQSVWSVTEVRIMWFTMDLSCHFKSTSTALSFSTSQALRSEAINKRKQLTDISFKKCKAWSPLNNLHPKANGSNKPVKCIFKYYLL